MSKIYLALSTDEKELNNIQELTSVYNDFDGLAVTFHGNTDSDAYKVILERKKDGFVVTLPYYGHHAHDLNNILFHPVVKIGDWILLRDSAERVNPDFSFNIRPFIKMLEEAGINTVYQYSKLLLFKRFPHQCFLHTPHWGFQGAQNKMISIEKQSWFTEDKEYCYSMRNETRGKYHFIDSFMRYYLINDSNHNLLGLENFGDPAKLFPILENRRMDFLLYLIKVGVNNDVESVKEFFKTQGLTPELKVFLNTNLILNQFYRYHILNDLSVSPDIASPIVEIT